MSAQTEDYVDAIEHLPEGALLTLGNVEWDEYERLVEYLNERPGFRVTYDQGRLEIMSPSAEHEEFKEVILAIARVLSEELDILLETRGSTTYRRKSKSKGAEPDTSFYVQHAASQIGNRTLDLNVDPPPDVVVEIDVTGESRNKFPIYAAFGVPEIWLYKRQQVRFYELSGDAYVEVPRSLAFPILTSSALTLFVERTKSDGQSRTLAAFRQWVREQKQA